MLLPILRRAFSSFQSPQRRAMGERLSTCVYPRQKHQQQRNMVIVEESTIHQARADTVLPILAHIMGVPLDGH